MATPQWARCNECGAEMLFDAYADFMGNIVHVFDNADCSGCDIRGTSRGFTVVDGHPSDEEN